ncbi:NAD(P)-binding protein, partial [Aureobasidium melanogenum]
MSSQSTGRDHLPSTMIGVVLTGHGGFEKLQYRKDLKIPSPGPDEVLIRVAAAGINNTDINTRIGWHSKGVETGTGEETTNASATRTDDDSAWSGKPLEFPRIQGADCCGRIVAAGNNVSSQRIGERVLVRNMLRSYVNYRPYECWTFGSECDGAFAQYTKAPARETYKIDCDLSDTDLASVPCAWSTAENMLHRAGVKDKENVLITGASGGVGAAAIQLAKRRGAHVVAIGSAEKADQMLALGADRVLPRGANLVKRLGKDVVDVVLDLVAGSVFPELLDVLKKGGRYAVAGAIAGPIVKLDVRTLYLKDLSFFGCTFQEDEVFTNLISYIERATLQFQVDLREIGALDTLISMAWKKLKRTIIKHCAVMPGSRRQRDHGLGSVRKKQKQSSRFCRQEKFSMIRATCVKAILKGYYFGTNNPEPHACCGINHGTSS